MDGGDYAAILGFTVEISGEIGIHGGDPIFMGWRLAHCRVISSHIKAVGMKCAGSRYGVGCPHWPRGIMGVVRLNQPQNIFLFIPKYEKINLWGIPWPTNMFSAFA